VDQQASPAKKKQGIRHEVLRVAKLSEPSPRLVIARCDISAIRGTSSRPDASSTANVGIELRMAAACAPLDLGRARLNSLVLWIT